MRSYSIFLAQVDDWEALYVNGACWHQDHGDLLEQWMRSIDAPFQVSAKTIHFFRGRIHDHVCDWGRFPNTLDELFELIQRYNKENDTED